MAKKKKGNRVQEPGASNFGMHRT